MSISIQDIAAHAEVLLTNSRDESDLQDARREALASAAGVKVAARIVQLSAKLNVPVAALARDVDFQVASVCEGQTDGALAHMVRVAIVDTCDATGLMPAEACGCLDEALFQVNLEEWASTVAQSGCVEIGSVGVVYIRLSRELPTDELARYVCRALVDFARQEALATFSTAPPAGGESPISAALLPRLADLYLDEYARVRRGVKVFDEHLHGRIMAVVSAGASRILELSDVLSAGYPSFVRKVSP